MRFLIGFLVGCFLTAVVVGGGLLAVTWPRDQIVTTAAQPAGVHYADASQHFAVLIRRRRIAGEHWQLAVGRDRSAGYAAFYPVSRVMLGSTSSPHLDVTWRPNEAVIRFGSGHALVVPASAFTGGR